MRVGSGRWMPAVAIPVQILVAFLGFSRKYKYKWRKLATREPLYLLLMPLLFKYLIRTSIKIWNYK